MAVVTLVTPLTQHGPVTDRDPGCPDCNHDTHRCPGCGDWLFHGTSCCVRKSGEENADAPE